MRRRRHGRSCSTSRSAAAPTFLKENASFRRYVLRELERARPAARPRARGPLGATARDAPWWGARDVGIMLEILHGAARSRSSAAAASSACGISPSAGIRRRPSASRSRRPQRALDEKRRRAAGVRLVKGEWHAHPDASDEPVDDRVTLLSPFDRLIHDRDAARGALRLPLPPRDVRAEGEARVRLLRAADPRRRPDRRPRRAASSTARPARSTLLGAWGDTSRLDEALASLEAFLRREGSSLRA